MVGIGERPDFTCLLSEKALPFIEGGIVHKQKGLFRLFAFLSFLLHKGAGLISGSLIISDRT